MTNAEHHKGREVSIEELRKRYCFDDRPDKGITLETRLEAMQEAQNGDDVDFLVECVRYWRKRALGQ